MEVKISAAHGLLRPRVPPIMKAEGEASYRENSYHPGESYESI
jgi:hypothetical protein